MKNKINIYKKKCDFHVCLVKGSSNSHDCLQHRQPSVGDLYARLTTGIMEKLLQCTLILYTSQNYYALNKIKILENLANLYFIIVYSN